MTPILYAFSEALLHFVWQGLLVAVLLWAALFCLRKRSARARYAASGAALALMTALPAVTTWVLHTRPLAPHAGSAGGDAVPAAVQVVWTTVTGVASSNWLTPAEAWALPIWSIGVLIFSLRMVWGCTQVSLLRRRGSPASEPVLAMIAGLSERMGLLRRVRVIVSAVTDGPSVIGWIRPLILLPASAVAGLTPEQLEAVLAHELAHIRRHDYLFNLLQMVSETLLFYHPAVWWVSARIRRERELCCDDLAVAACRDAFCYARALTVLEKLRLTSPAMALGSTGGPLLYRIQRIVGVTAQENGPSRVSGLIALALAVACIGMSVRWARAQSQDGPKEMIGFAYLRVLENGVTVDTGGAMLLHRPEIDYPESLRRKVQGTVTLEVTLDGAGKVSDAHVVSGPAELRLGALRAVLGFHFASQEAGSTRQVRMRFQPPADEATVKITELDARNVSLPAPAELGNNVTLVVDGPQEGKKLINLQRVRGDVVLVPGEGHPPAKLAGRALVRLSIDGLTDSARAALEARLSVREGDILSAAMIERIGTELHQFDEDFEANWTIEADKGGARLRIAPRQ